MKPSQRATFAEHVQELRSRLMWVISFLLIGAGFGYAMRDYLIAFLQRPLNQDLYYTTPGGAFSFVMKVSISFGFIVALPMLVYQTFAFFGPLIKIKTKRSFVLYVIASLVLAVAGIAMAYYVSLPAALHFLVNFGGESGIKSLITANEYFNFVLTYIAGFAALFQVPLIILLIDRIHPVPPMKLLGAFKWVVLGSFVISAVITPTPDPMNQGLMAGPVIILYLFSVGVVALRTQRRAKKARRALLPTLSSPVKEYSHPAGASTVMTPDPVRPIVAAQPQTATAMVAKPKKNTGLISDIISPQKKTH